MIHRFHIILYLCSVVNKTRGSVPRTVYKLVVAVIAFYKLRFFALSGLIKNPRLTARAIQLARGSKPHPTKVVFSRPCGTKIIYKNRFPSDKSLGYYHLSLRDLHIGSLEEKNP